MRRVFVIMSNAARSPVRALVFVAAIWLVIGWLTGYLRSLDESLGVELPAWVQVPGVLAVVAGAAGVLLCGALLSTRGIGTLHGEEWHLPKEFLASGPFRYVRNPMSLGGVVLMVGIALCHRSTLALALAAGLFIVMHLVIVRIEEPGIEKRFRESYREYKRNVPRWLPRWRPWHGSSA
jgi:protein-S-isoprenylcysteine O-methyltransferase Ste14